MQNNFYYSNRKIPKSFDRQKLTLENNISHRVHKHYLFEKVKVKKMHQPNNYLFYTNNYVHVNKYTILIKILEVL